MVKFPGKLWLTSALYSLQKQWLLFPLFQRYSLWIKKTEGNRLRQKKAGTMALRQQIKLNLKLCSKSMSTTLVHAEFALH